MINCLAWYNTKRVVENDPCRHLIVVGTKAGKLKLIDYEKNRIVHREDLTSKVVLFDCDWN